MKITRTIAVTATAVFVAAATANAQTTTTTETQTNSDGATSSTKTVDEAPTTEPIQPVPGDLTAPPPASSPVVNNTVIVPTDEPRVMNQGGAYVPPSRIGFSLLAGGGVQDFTGSNIRDMTGTAGFWDVRAGVGTRSIVGLEAAYVGAAQSITALGLESDAKLMSNGVEGDVRVHAPLAYQGTLLEPYAFGGVGWQRYSIVNTPIATASLTNNDDVVTVPMGAGFAAGYRGFLADLRFTYRMVERANLLAPSGGGSLSNWNLGAHLGYEF